MKKILYVAFAIMFLIIGCQEVTQREVRETYCVITKVKHYRIGEKHTLQTTPEWRAITNCGTTHILRNPVGVGDTLLLKIIYYKN